MIERKYYISFVVATRNDNHGGNMIKKNQYFIDNWIKKTKKYKLSSELIIVEWNPDKNKKPLRKVLKLPKLQKYQSIKIITVKNDVYKKINLNKKIKFYQMIAKNIGVIRSKGKFILSTNIDIVFSDELIKKLSEEKLKSKTIYTSVRYDLNFNDFKKEINNNNFSKYLTHINTKNYSYDVKNKKYYFVNRTFLSLFLDNKKILKFKKIKFKKFKFIKLKKIFLYFWKYFFNIFFEIKIHTNASGDFTLIDSKSWELLRGYYEFKGYSWHLDSLLLFRAYNKNFSFKIFNEKIFHINHNIGTGFTPGNKKLFENLKKNKIEYLNDKKLNRIKNILKNNPNYLENNLEWGCKKLLFKSFIA